MFRKKFYIVLAGVAALTLAACKDEQSLSGTNETASIQKADQSRFYVAGIDSDQMVSDFLDTVKQAVANDDRKKVASLIQYPMGIYDGGELIKTYPDSASVLESYDTIFDDEVKSELAKATFDTLFVTQEGVMIGQGQIWFNEFDGAMKIMVVQNIN